MKNSLLLHGALGTEGDLNELKTEMTKNGYKVYTFNFSGHGAAPFAKHFGIKQFTVELDRFIQKNNIEKPLLFGYSMGGYIALNYALTNSKSIDKIITLGTKFYWQAEFVSKETQQLQAAALKEKAPAFVDLLKKNHGVNWELLLIKTAEMMRELENSHKDFLKKIQQIDLPVLIGRAEKDQMVSEAETQAVCASIKNAKSFTLANCKHPLGTVDPHALCKVLLNFDQ